MVLQGMYYINTLKQEHDSAIACWRYLLRREVEEVGLSLIGCHRLHSLFVNEDRGNILVLVS